MKNDELTIGELIDRLEEARTIEGAIRTRLGITSDALLVDMRNETWARDGSEILWEIDPEDAALPENFVYEGYVDAEWKRDGIVAILHDPQIGQGMDILLFSEDRRVELEDEPDDAL